MALSLPRLVVLGAGGPSPQIAESPPATLLRPDEVELLASRTSGEEVAEHCEPLQGNRWAVGRKMTASANGGVFVWRVVDLDARHEIGGHPAWLWTQDDWFDPAVSASVDVGLPAALPLRQVLLHAGSALGRGGQPATMAAVVEAVRSSTKPVALKVSGSALTGHDHRARWAMLGTLSVLPTAVGHAMRVRVGAPPSPDAIDLTVLSESKRDYTVVDISRPPKRVHDVAAYFVHDRLADDDPETVEAASALYGQGDEDWATSISELIQEGLVGKPEVLQSLGGAVSTEGPSPAARADEELSAATVEELIREARRTGAPEPWRALRRRPAVQRSTAVRALAAAAETLEPSPELVAELAVVYPRGATLDEWLPALTGWLRRGLAMDAVVQAIQTTLLEWPAPVTSPLRLQVWPSVIAELVRHGRNVDAAKALLRSPMATALAKDGHGQALVDGWRHLPRSERGTPNQKAMAELLRSAPNGAELFAALKSAGTSTPPPSRERSATPRGRDRTARPSNPARGSRADSRSPTTSKPRTTSAGAPRATSAGSAGTPSASKARTTSAGTPRGSSRTPASSRGRSRAAGAERGAPPIRSASPRTTSAGEPRDRDRPSTVTSAPRQRGTPAPAPPRGADARTDLLSLAQRAVVTPDVEGRMLAAAASAVAKTRFPDLEIAAVAEQMAGQAETNRAWGWLALASATPGTWSNDIIDDTLYAFCSDPPDDPLGRKVALAGAHALGQARKWDAIGQARWIVQLAIAPESPLNRPMVKALLEGIAKRTDGTPFLSDIVVAILQLPPDHDAVHWLLELLVPSGWRGERLARVLRSVSSDQIPRELATKWNALLTEAGG